jgi:hypothetical protein
VVSNLATFVNLDSDICIFLDEWVMGLKILKKVISIVNFYQKMGSDEGRVCIP